jgi:hypothetical protein
VARPDVIDDCRQKAAWEIVSALLHASPAAQVIAILGTFIDTMLNAPAFVQRHRTGVHDGRESDHFLLTGAEASEPEVNLRATHELAGVTRRGRDEYRQGTHG